MDDAEGTVAVLHARRDDAERDKVVDLLQLDPLPLEFLADAPQALDAALNLRDRDRGVAELGADARLQLLHQPFGRAAPRIHFCAQRLVFLGLQISEGQLLELVFHLAHPEPVGDRRVDIPRLLRNSGPLVIGQVAQCACCGGGRRASPG
jgi:hypothetical protein